MKKIIILLIIFTTLCIFSACDSNNDDKKEVSNVLCGFDSYEELTSVSWIHSFGKVELSKEKALTQGTNCAKLTVDGSKNSEQNKPTMVVYSDSKYCNKQDFRNVSSVEFDVYNDNDVEKTIYLQFEVSKLDSAGSVVYNNSAEYAYKLESGKLTHVVWELNRPLLNEFLNLESVTLIKVIYEHPNQGNRDIYYVDNLSFTTTNEPVSKIKIRQNGEIESAEKEEYLAAWYVTMPQHCPCSLSYNSNLDYVKKGSGSFKLTVPETTTKNTPTITYSSSINADVSKYNSLVFWVYNANDTNYNVYIEIEKRVVYFPTLIAHEWNRCEVKFDDVDKIKTSMTGPVLEDEIDWKNLSKFNLTFYTIEENAEKVFYIDDIFVTEKDTRPPFIGDIVYDDSTLGETISVKIPNIERGSLETIEVFEPNGTSVGVNINAFTINKEGIYKIKYIAKNQYEYSEKVCEVKVGFPKITFEQYGYKDSKEFVFEVPTPVLKNCDSCTWNLFNAYDGSYLEENKNKSSYVIPSGLFYVEFYAENEIGNYSTRIYLYNYSDNTVLLGEKINDFYSSLYFENANEVVVSDDNDAPLEKEAIKLTATNSTTQIKEKIYLCQKIDNQTVFNKLSFSFAITNPTNKNIVISYGGDTSHRGEIIIAPKNVKIIYLPFSAIHELDCMLEEDNKFYLTKFNFNLTSGDIAYISCFMLSKSIPELSIEDELLDLECDGTSQFNVPNDEVWSVKVFEDNEEIVLSQGSFIPMPNVAYKFIYSYTDVYGTYEKEKTVIFNHINRAKFSDILDNVLIAENTTSGSLKTYIENNKPTLKNTEDTIKCELTLWYGENPSASSMFGGGEENVYKPLEDNLDFAISSSWIYRLRWIAENIYGQSEFIQFIYVKGTETQIDLYNNSVVTGNAVKENSRIIVTGDSVLKIEVGESNYTTLKIMVSNLKSLNTNLVITNDSSTKNAGAWDYQTVNNNAVVIIINNGDVATYIQNGYLILNLSIICNSNNAEIYIDNILIS